MLHCSWERLAPQTQHSTAIEESMTVAVAGGKTRMSEKVESVLWSHQLYQFPHLNKNPKVTQISHREGVF